MRRALALALLLSIALADQGAPVYMAVPTYPVLNGPCTVPRVQIEAQAGGKIWVCVAGQWQSGGGGGGTPGGSDKQVQFNDSGQFAGMSGTSWDKATSILRIRSEPGSSAPAFKLYSTLFTPDAPGDDYIQLYVDKQPGINVPTLAWRRNNGGDVWFATRMLVNAGSSVFQGPLLLGGGDPALAINGSSWIGVRGGASSGTAQATSGAVRLGNSLTLNTAGDKIASFYSDNFLTEKAYIDKDGRFYTNLGSYVATGIRSGNGVYDTNGNYWVTLAGNAQPSGTAIGIILNNATSLTTAGDKLVSVQNAGTEKASIDKDGNLTSTGYLLGTRGDFSDAANGQVYVRANGNYGWWRIWATNGSTTNNGTVQFRSVNSGWQGWAFDGDNLWSQMANGVLRASAAADSGSYVGLLLNSPSQTIVGSKLMSLQNNSVEKFYVDKDGLVVSPSQGFSTDGNVRASNLTNPNSMASLTLLSNAQTGFTGDRFIFNQSNTPSGAGNLVAFQTGGVTKASIDKDGIVSGYYFTGTGGSSTFTGVQIADGATGIWSNDSTNSLRLAGWVDDSVSAKTLFKFGMRAGRSLTNASSKIASFYPDNLTTEVAYLGKDGSLGLGSFILTPNGASTLDLTGTLRVRGAGEVRIGDNGDGTLRAAGVQPQLTNQVTSISGTRTTSGSAIGVRIGNSTALTTTGDKIASFYSDAFTTERAFIDKDGSPTFNGPTLTVNNNADPVNIVTPSNQFTFKTNTSTASLDIRNNQVKTYAPLVASCSSAYPSCFQARAGNSLIANFMNGAGSGTLSTINLDGAFGMAASPTLPTCDSTSHGYTYRQGGTAGTYTYDCHCEYDGTTYRWRNIETNSQGNATTCPSGTTVPVSAGGTGLATAAIDSVLLANPANTWTAGALPSCSDPTNSKLLYNTTTHVFSCGTDQGGAGGGAPTTSKYLLQQADGSLPNAQAMGALSTGIVKNTTTTGVQSIATSGTDYAPGTSANGTGLVYSTNGTGALTTYAGTSCTNQFTRSLSAAGAATCAGVGVADFTPNQGTTSTVLHGNASGQPSYGAVALATDVSGQLGVTSGGTAQATWAANEVLVGTGAAAVARKSIPSCSNASTSKLLYDNSTQTFSCGTDQTGGGGGAAGNATEIQYNAGSGAFGASADFTFDNATKRLTLGGDDTEVVMHGITNEPTAPSAGNILFYTKDIGGRMMPKWIGPSGVDTPIQPFFGFNAVRIAQPGGGTTGTTALSCIGMGCTGGASTYGNTTPATGSLKSRTRLATFSSSSTAGNVSGWRSAQVEVARETGFYFVWRGGLQTTVSGNRGFFGLWASASAPTNVDPTTTTTAHWGFCFNANSGNLKLCWADGTTAGSSDLGASMPFNTTDLWELVGFCAPGGSTISYRITNLSSAYQTTGSSSTNIPPNTTYLAIQEWMTNNAQASVVAFVHKVAYLESDY